LKRFLDPWAIGLIAVMAYFSIRSGAFNDPRTWILTKLYLLPGIVIGLSFHEFAHAWISDRLGDDTPRLQGRVTLNPAAHIDLVGFIALIFVGFGWGVPVEIDPSRYKNRKAGEILVSLSGVVMNFALAFVFTVVLKLVYMAVGYYPSGVTAIIVTIIIYAIQINLVLMVFNLMPIPPLDGFNLISTVFNLRRYKWWYQIYDKGMIILMVLILFNFTDYILSPAVDFFWKILSAML
jgi:Zn-dependent protease